MKRKISLILMFIVVSMFCVLQNKSYEKNIIEKTREFAIENLMQMNNFMERYYDSTENYLDYVEIDTLKNVSLNDLNTVENEKVIEELKKCSLEDKPITSITLILENDQFYNIGGKFGNIYSNDFFSNEELYAVKKLYSDIELTQNRRKITVEAENIDNYKTYVGQPIININNEFIGIKLVEETEKFVLSIFNNSDDKIIKFGYAIQNAGNVYETSQFTENALQNGTIEEKGRKMLDDISIKANINLLKTYPEFYGFRIVMLMYIVLFGIYVNILFRKKEKGIRIFSFALFIMFLWVAAIGNNWIKNIVVERINYTIAYYLCSYADMYERYDFFFNLSTLQRNVELVYENLNDSNEMSDDVLKIVLNKDNTLKKYLETEKSCTAIYIYDENKAHLSMPINDYMRYITPTDKSYDVDSYTNNKYFYEYKYDENFKDNMHYLSFPLIKDNQVKVLISFVYDGKLLKNKILNLYKDDDFSKILIGNDNKIYKYENNKFVYVGKEVVDDSNSQPNLTQELVDNSVKYAIDENKLSKQNKVWTFDSVYLDGQVVIFNSSNRTYEIFLLIAVIGVIDAIVILVTCIHNYRERNEKNKEKFKTETINLELNS